MTENDKSVQDEIKEAEVKLKALKSQARGGSPAQSLYVIPISIVIAGLLIAGAVFFSRGGSSDNAPILAAGGFPTQPGQPAGSAVDIDNVDAEGEPFIGDADAPVTLAYWGDFQCPFCKRFDLQTLSVLEKDYVKTGKLRVVFKDFQFLGPDSQTAGLAAKAVWELYPDKYFAWHKAMFEIQDGENSGFGKKEDILQLIRDEVPGIDASKVSALMEEKSAEYQQEQDADKAEGAQFGISGTPGFVIGNQQISGAQPTSVFTQVIDSLLN